MEGMICAIAKNLKKGFVIFTMFLSLATSSSWKTPCGGPPAAPPPGFPVPPPLTLVTAMRPILEEVIKKSSDLKNKYIYERFINDNEKYLPIMNAFHFDGMPQCHLTLAEMANSLSNLTNVHQSNYEKISKALVFLEQVALDEGELETSSYIDDVSGIQTDSLNLLCNNQNLILNAGATIDYVSSSVMSDDLREFENQYERHVRDYIIIKDVDSLLDNMLLYVQVIETHLLKQEN